jgi:hypothetical protein
MTEILEIADEHVTEAIERIARTGDGQILYLWLQARCMAVRPFTETGALLKSEGERSFAAQLMALMAKGVEESGGTGERRPIVFAARRPVAVDRRSGSRLVGPNDRVAGWDGPAGSE